MSATTIFWSLTFSSLNASHSWALSFLILWFLDLVSEYQQYQDDSAEEEAEFDDEDEEMRSKGRMG